MILAVYLHILSSLLLLFLNLKQYYHVNAADSQRLYNMLFPLSAHLEFPKDSPYPIALIMHLFSEAAHPHSRDSVVITHHHTVTLFLAYYLMPLLLKNLAHYVFTKYPLCIILLKCHVRPNVFQRKGTKFFYERIIL